MDERQQAWQIANQWLDFRFKPITQMVPGDPDCDAVVLARQYMRALDTIHQLRELVAMGEAPQSVKENSIVHGLLNSPWPKSVQP